MEIVKSYIILWELHLVKAHKLIDGRYVIEEPNSAGIRYSTVPEKEFEQAREKKFN